MLSLVLALSLGQGLPFCGGASQEKCWFPTREQRASKGLRAWGRRAPSGGNYAYFEFAPASGAGMGTACSCAATGAKGETITLTRGSQAYCTKEGFVTSGLTTTSMVLCAANQPRVQADNAGVLGVLTESSRTNVLLRTEEFGNVAWVSTATVTANTTLSPWNALTSDTLSDSDGIGIQSSCQTVATSSAVRFSASAFIRAGTLAKASVRMTGTGSSTGDCVASTTSLASTYTRLGCTSPAAYAGTLTAITVCVEVGTVVGDTGTIIVNGAQLEAGNWTSSYIPTDTAAVSRNADGPLLFSGVSLAGLAASGSASASVSPLNVTSPTAALVMMASAGRPLYLNTTARIYDGTTEPTLANGLTLGVAERYWSSWSGATLTLTNATDVTQSTGAFDGAMDTTGPLQVAADTIVGTSGDWIVSRVCLDPNPLRCR